MTVIQYYRTDVVSQDPNARETVQSDNFLSALESLEENARIIIHAGHGHAAEEPFVIDENLSIDWFIAQVKERTSLDPLTINLSNCGRSEMAKYALAKPAFDKLAAGFDLFVMMPLTEMRTLSAEITRSLGLSLYELSAEDRPEERSLLVVREENCSNCQPNDILLWDPKQDDKPVLLVPTSGEYWIEHLSLASPQEWVLP